MLINLSRLAAGMLLAFSSIVASAPPPSTVFMESFEGEEASIQTFELGGVFADSDLSFNLRMESARPGWWVRLRIGPLETRIRLAGSTYGRVIFSNVVVVRRSRSPSDRVIVVRIPYGTSQDECFLNGEDVYENLTIFVSGEGIEEVNRLSFPDCVPVYSRIRVETSPDGFIVGG